LGIWVFSHSCHRDPLRTLEHHQLARPRRWRPGTLAAELARALASEQRPKEPVPAPAPILLENITTIDKTQRIDGILPLIVPSPNHIGPSVTELIAEADRLDLGPAPEDDTELTLALLAILHRRSLVTNAQLAIELTLACPAEHFMVLGLLPLGGRTTIALTSVEAGVHGDFTPSDVIFLDRLTLSRDSSGHLQLTPVHQLDDF